MGTHKATKRYKLKSNPRAIQKIFKGKDPFG